MINKIDQRNEILIATNKFFNNLIFAIKFSINDMREWFFPHIGKILRDNYKF